MKLLRQVIRIRRLVCGYVDSPQFLLLLLGTKSVSQFVFRPPCINLGFRNFFNCLFFIVYHGYKVYVTLGMSGDELNLAERWSV